MNWFNMRKLRLSCNKSSIMNIGQLCGTLGVMLRLILFIITVIEIAEIQNDPRGIGTLFIITFFCYCIFTLTTNVILVFGIVKERPTLIIPHTVIQGIEIILFTMFSVFGSSFMEIINYDSKFWAFVPLDIFILVFFVVSFISSIILFRRMQTKTTSL